MDSQPYPSDLTNAQWEVIKPLIPSSKPGGCPREVNIREVINGIFYLNRSGCSWQMLSGDFPRWGTVHYYYRKWRLDGIWERIHDILRDEVRKAEGHETSPSAGIIDSQSVKTTDKDNLG